MRNYTKMGVQQLKKHTANPQSSLLEFLFGNWLGLPNPGKYHATQRINTNGHERFSRVIRIRRVTFAKITQN